MMGALAGALVAIRLTAPDRSSSSSRYRRRARRRDLGGNRRAAALLAGRRHRDQLAAPCLRRRPGARVRRSTTSGSSRSTAPARCGCPSPRSFLRTCACPGSDQARTSTSEPGSGWRSGSRSWSGCSSRGADGDIASASSGSTPLPRTARYQCRGARRQRDRAVRRVLRARGRRDAHRLGVPPVARFANNVGWTGLLVALVARNNAGAAIVTALLFGALEAGASSRPRDHRPTS